MRFYARKRRQPPAVIIISLIDILIVLLIFMMVTTTFKQQPALKLILPESRQAKPGASTSNLEVMIRSNAVIYFGGRAVTRGQLEQELRAKAASNPQISLAIRTDEKAPFGEVVHVLDAIRSARITNYVFHAKLPVAP